MPDDVLIVFCTFPVGDQITDTARTLVGEHLAACVNIVPAVRSIYSWQGTLQDDSEQLALIKTTQARFDALKQRLVELHPYDVPEVIAVPVDRGHAPYLEWVRRCSTTPT